MKKYILSLAFAFASTGAFAAPMYMSDSDLSSTVAGSIYVYPATGDYTDLAPRTDPILNVIVAPGDYNGYRVRIERCPECDG